MSSENNKAMLTRLCIMMFLQFFVWGAWFVTLALCLSENSLGDAIAGAYGSAPIAAIISPLFLGVIADRFFSSEKIMGALLLLGGALMCMVPTFAHQGNTSVIVWIFIAHMLCYMPTLGLSNTIAFTHISDQKDFPKIRVWGTIGWIAAGLFTGLMGWSASINIFWVAGICSIALGLFSFSLPNTPPPAKGKAIDIRTLLMLDGLKMLMKPAFLVFIICSTAICIPLAYYYGVTSMFLADIGFDQPASFMTLGQMSEIVFMLLIPFFFRKLGVKWMILVGMLAWVVRYGLFAMGATNQVVWMMLIAILLHGICYDFFFVTGFMYTDKEAKKEVRSQAQSMLVFFTQGIGMFFGYKVAFAKFGSTVTGHEALAKALSTAKPAESLSFIQKTGKMFSVNMPQIDTTLLSDTVAQWKEMWILPCIMAAVIMVIFALAFRPGKTEEAQA
jgi:nucleoside transporter